MDRSSICVTDGLWHIVCCDPFWMHTVYLYICRLTRHSFSSEGVKSVSWWAFPVPTSDIAVRIDEHIAHWSSDLRWSVDTFLWEGSRTQVWVRSSTSVVSDRVNDRSDPLTGQRGQKGQSTLTWSNAKRGNKFGVVKDNEIYNINIKVVVGILMWRM